MLELKAQSANTLALVGRLDAAQAERAFEAILALEGPPTLDLTGLKYVASAGISVLVRARQAAAARGHAMTLVGLQPQVQTVMHYSRLEDLFTIVPTPTPEGP